MSSAQIYQSTVKAIPYQEVARMTPTLLTPLAAIAALMAIWRFGVDVGWSDAFAISDGMLSHWEVWLALAIAIQWTAKRLDQRIRRQAQ